MIGLRLAKVMPASAIPTRGASLAAALLALLLGALPPAGGQVFGEPPYRGENGNGQAGSGGRAVAYRAGQRVVRSPEVVGRAPDARLFRTGFGGWEPTLGITPGGTIMYAARNNNLDPVVIRSRNGARRWKAASPRVGPVRSHQMSLDPYLWVDPETGRTFDTDIDATITCTPLSFSDDEGKTWTYTRVCGHVDHQSVFGGPPRPGGLRPEGYPNVVYYCAINGGVGADTSTASTCSRSLDGGLTWEPTGEPAYPPRIAEGGSLPWCDGAHGHGVVDSRGIVYLPRGWCGLPFVAISRDEGATWTQVQVAERRFPAQPGSGELAHEAGIAVDRRGNAYYTWVAKNLHVYLAVSRDRGKTWEKPLDVTPPGVTRTSLPAIDVGSSGSIAVAFMGTRDPATKPEEKTTWDGYIAISVNALAADPLFYAASVNHPRKNILWRGSCGTVRCGNTGDFFDVVIGPEGTPWAAFVDSCPQGDTCTEFTVHTPRGEAIVGRLVGGPPLRGAR